MEVVIVSLYFSLRKSTLPLFTATERCSEVVVSVFFLPFSRPSTLSLRSEDTFLFLPFPLQRNDFFFRWYILKK